MTEVVPDYYNDFLCIADKCKHSCCIGWEIDVDDSAYNLYKSLNTPFGDKILKSVTGDKTSRHFILGTDDKCPFLDKNGLCDIIKELGEEALCNICKDHPRFRNFFDDRVEIGLGLCCEAAAELILSRKNKTELIHRGDFKKDEFFLLRNKIFEIIQDRDYTIDERIEKLFENFGVDISDKSLSEWLDIYLDLERLDPSWETLLENAKGGGFPALDEELSEDISIASEQLLFYFVYRHIADGLYDGYLYERIAFAVLSLRIITALWQNAGDLSLNALIDLSRRYSLEIEYSDENIEKVLALL